MGLPVLVAHGPLIWKLVFVSGVAASFGALHALRARRANRLARQVRDELLREVASPAAGQGVIRGTITSGTATTTATGDAHEDATADLVLDCGGAVVAIDGAVYVAAGARSARRGAAIVRSVGPGDDVLVAGVLAPEPGAGSYRETEVRWRITGEPAIRICAGTPRTRPVPLRRGQLLGALAALVPLWLGGLFVIGAIAERVAEDQSRLEARDGRLPALGAAELACAMPGWRARGLELVDRQLPGDKLATTEDGLAAAVEISELRGFCPDLLLTGHARLEDALVAARRCGDRAQVIDLLAFLGRFDEAEREIGPNDTGHSAVVVHIATGHWAAAAAGVEARAAELGRGSAVVSVEEVESIATLHCLAALLRSYGGDHAAFDKLADRGRGHGCAILEAAAQPVERQADAFAAIAKDDGAENLTRAGYSLIARSLSYAAGRATAGYDAEATLALSARFERDRIWLAPFQLASHPDDPVAESNMVALAILRGDLADARAHLAHTTMFQDELAASIALREPGPIAAPRDTGRGLDEALALRAGKVPTDLVSYMTERDHFVQLVTRAAAGDGEALVDALHEYYLQWDSFALPLLGLLPRITSHRDDVIAALRLFRNDVMSFSMMHLPFLTLADAAMYRDTARLAGDTEDAARWQGIIDRYVPVLRDRQKLTALLFWDN